MRNIKVPTMSSQIVKDNLLIHQNSFYNMREDDHYVWTDADADTEVNMSWGLQLVLSGQQSKSPKYFIYNDLKQSKSTNPHG